MSVGILSLFSCMATISVGDSILVLLSCQSSRSCQRVLAYISTETPELGDISPILHLHFHACDTASASAGDPVGVWLWQILMTVSYLQVRLLKEDAQ